LAGAGVAAAGFLSRKSAAKEGRNDQSAESCSGRTQKKATAITEKYFLAEQSNRVTLFQNIREEEWQTVFFPMASAL
jgi:hypothetical protein